MNNWEQTGTHVHSATKREPDEFSKGGFSTNVFCIYCDVEQLFCKDCNVYYCPECQVKNLLTPRKVDEHYPGDNNCTCAVCDLEAFD